MTDMKDRQIDLLKNKLHAAEEQLKALQLRFKATRLRLKQVTDKYEELKRDIAAEGDGFGDK
jgi:septation ring formation regulator EzrA